MIKNQNCILVVDDDRRMRKAIVDFFTYRNYRMLEAGDGKEALDIFEKFVDMVDLILLDVMMPEKDGIMVLREVRELSDVPVILLTAKDKETDQITGFRQGAKDFGGLSAYKEDYLFYDRPVIERGSENLTLSGLIEGSDTEYYVLLDSPVSAVHHSVRLIFELNTKISVFAVIIGMIGAWIAGKKFTKPILEIDEVARAITKLDFSPKVELTSREDGIGTLGNNINLMSSHLSDAMEKLQLANAQLEKDIIHQKNLDKMRKEFIANVSHELKSPLALLTMSCANLKDGCMQEDDKNFYCDVIMDECLRLGTLVQNLLQIAKLENAIEVMQKENLNFSDFVEWVFSKYFVVFKEKEIRVKSEIKPDIYVFGSKVYLEQAIINYLDNAVNHTEKKGKIEIFLKSDNSQAVFSVFNLGRPIKRRILRTYLGQFL